MKRGKRFLKHGGAFYVLSSYNKSEFRKDSDYEKNKKTELQQ